MRYWLAILLLLVSMPVSAATVAHGSSAKYWDDVVVGALSLRAGGTAPDFQEWASHAGLYVYFFDAGTSESMFGSIQMPHRWDGGAINFHVHWFPRVASDGNPANQVPQWCIDYSFVDIGVVFPSIVTAACATEPLPNDATIALDKHYITIIPAITPTTDQNTGSSVLYFRLYRNSANAADNYESDAGLLSVDAHFQSDKQGSQTAVPE
jgi:hypothetical protein